MLTLIGLRGRAVSDFTEILPKVANSCLSCFGMSLDSGEAFYFEIIHLISLRAIGLRKPWGFERGMNSNYSILQ